MNFELRDEEFLRLHIKSLFHYSFVLNNFGEETRKKRRRSDLVPLQRMKKIITFDTKTNLIEDR